MLCTTSGRVGVESVEYYNFWAGEELLTVYAYTDDGLYDYVIVRLADNCESVTYNEHLRVDGFSECAVAHADKPCNHQIVKNSAKEATCTQAGYTGDEVCTVCGKVVKKGKVIAKLGHSYSSSYTVDKKATTTSNGSKSKHCTRCNAKTSVTTIYKASNVKL